MSDEGKAMTNGNLALQLNNDMTSINAGYNWPGAQSTARLANYGISIHDLTENPTGTYYLTPYHGNITVTISWDGQIDIDTEIPYGDASRGGGSGSGQRTGGSGQGSVPATPAPTTPVPATPAPATPVPTTSAPATPAPNSAGRGLAPATDDENERDEGEDPTRGAWQLTINLQNSGGAPLSGAVYTVYDGGYPECTITTDSSGSGTSNTQLLGAYTVKQTTAPAGYALDTTVYNVNVGSAGTTLNLVQGGSTPTAPPTNTPAPTNTPPPGGAVAKSVEVYTYAGGWGDQLTAITEYTVSGGVLNQVSHQTINYDSSGNPLGYLGETLEWEGKQLTGIAGVASYTYDENGIRTSKTVNGTKTDYYYNGALLTGMTVGTGTSQKVMRFSHDISGQAISVNFKDGTATAADYYYVRNGQGDIVKIIDSNGKTVVSYTYDTWGKQLSMTPTAQTGTTLNVATNLGNLQPFRYRGYVYDQFDQSGRGLYYLQSRYGNSGGRFSRAIKNSGGRFSRAIRKR